VGATEADVRASARIHVVEAQLVSRPMAAATALAAEPELHVDDVVVVHTSSKARRTPGAPCNVLARVALGLGSSPRRETPHRGGELRAQGRDLERRRR
jgi:hypothetical protein